MNTILYVVLHVFGCVVTMGCLFGGLFGVLIGVGMLSDSSAPATDVLWVSTIIVFLTPLGLEILKFAETHFNKPEI